MLDDIKSRLTEIKSRLNDLWFSGRGPAGGDILPEHRQEFEALLKEEVTIRQRLKLLQLDLV